MRMLGVLLAVSVTVLVIAPGALAANGAIDLSLSSDSVRAAYGAAWQTTSLDFEVGWLHNQDDGDVVDLSLHAFGVVGRNDSLDLGVGGRTLWVDADTGDGAAIALGMIAAWSVPRAPRLRLGASAHYAPDVVAFGDLEEYLQAGLSVSFLVVDRAQIYVGYRLVEVEFEDVPGSFEVDDSVHVGVRIGL